MKTRSTLLGLLLAFGVLLLGGLAAGRAYAQCCTPTPPCCTTPTPPCCTTPTPPCCTPPPPTPPSVCCDNNSRTNVHVNVSNVSVAVAASRAGSGSAAGAAVYYGGGGGGGGGYAAPMATGVIQGLAVDAGKHMKRVAYEASRTKMTRVVIQAVCIDDRTIPHPASQVLPDRNIDDAFEGEMYRCIAGTWLQATIADYHDKIDFSGGRTLTCHKNDALWHGAGGKVECRPQKPARDCNERSLLRRFGAGIKILTMVVTERYTAYREEEEKSEAYVASSMSLDGGVGGIVY